MSSEFIVLVTKKILVDAAFMGRKILAGGHPGATVNIEMQIHRKYSVIEKHDTTKLSVHDKYDTENTQCSLKIT